MTELLFLASVALSMVIARGLGRRLVSARLYRISLAVSAFLTTLLWLAMYLSHRVLVPGLLLGVVGAFLGGVAATGMAIGFAEYNAPPSPGVREKVLTYHISASLEYPPPRQLKRLVDIALATAGLIVTLPLWLLIAFAIWFEDPGPIFFTKNSVGIGGVTFHQLKFRSMKYDAERATGPVAATINDPRTLRCGKWLRRWHLDELPELVNVLAGTMSLVGPRPLRTVLVHRYLEELPRFAQRHVVKPGIVCIAQIEKYHMSPAERLRKDKTYIRRMSIALDLRLIWRAVITTIRGSRRDV